MNRSRRENDLVDLLAFHAERRGLKAWKRVKLRGVGLPDIDLLLKEGDELVGVEVKYIGEEKGAKFYLGLDEALALLFYGVDRAYLLHAYPTRVDETLELVDILPVGFMVYRGGEEPEVLREAPLNPFRGRGRVEEVRGRLEGWLAGLIGL